MILSERIKEHHSKTHKQSIPGKLYYVGLRYTRNVPFLDTGNPHIYTSFCWIEYNFSHTGNSLNYRMLYDIMYDYKALESECDWFDKKCTDLINLNFVWSESGGIFSLKGIWSCYWEQVNRYNKKEWAEYIADINEAIDSRTASVSEEQIDQLIKKYYGIIREQTQILLKDESNIPAAIVIDELSKVIDDLKAIK